MFINGFIELIHFIDSHGCPLFFIDGFIELFNDMDFRWFWLIFMNWVHWIDSFHWFSWISIDFYWWIHWIVQLILLMCSLNWFIIDSHGFLLISIDGLIELIVWFHGFSLIFIISYNWFIKLIYWFSWIPIDLY